MIWAILFIFLLKNILLFFHWLLLFWYYFIHKYALMYWFTEYSLFKNHSGKSLSTTCTCCVNTYVIEPATIYILNKEKTKTNQERRSKYIQFSCCKPNKKSLDKTNKQYYIKNKNSNKLLFSLQFCSFRLYNSLIPWRKNVQTKLFICHYFNEISQWETWLSTKKMLIDHSMPSSYWTWSYGSSSRSY